MKKLMLFSVALFFAAGGYAQPSYEEIDLIQSMFGVEKKAMVADFVKIDEPQKEAFWKLYDEYEASRKDLAKKRIDLFVDYTDNYLKMTNESADAWTKEAVDLGKKTDALLLTYYNKIKKITNPIVALQFYQFEQYILTSIRLKILSELPFPDQK
jgi:hypothetical protein